MKVITTCEHIHEEKKKTVHQPNDSSISQLYEGALTHTHAHTRKTWDYFATYMWMILNSMFDCHTTRLIEFIKLSIKSMKYQWAHTRQHTHTRKEKTRTKYLANANGFFNPSFTQLFLNYRCTLFCCCCCCRCYRCWALNSFGPTNWKCALLLQTNTMKLDSRSNLIRAYWK